MAALSRGTVLVLLTSCFALALVGWWVIFGSGGFVADTASEHRSGLTSTPPLDATDVGDASQQAPSRDPAEEPQREAQPAAAAWRLRGRAILGYRGGPVPGAELRVELHAGYERSEPFATQDVTTAKDGSFVAAFPVPDQTVTVRVAPRGANLRKTSTTRLVVRGRAPLEDLVVRLYPMDRTLAGRVVDSAGQPIRDANVRVYSKDSPCDAEGKFSVEISSASGTLTVWAAGPGYAVASTRVKLPKARDPEPVTITLQPGVVAAGRVVDEAGRPMAGVEVMTFTTTFYKHQQTGANGEFRLDYLVRSQARHSLTARKEGYLDATARIDSRRPEKHYELVMRRGVRVTGVVLDPTGQPVAGAPLYIGFSPSAFNRLDARSRDDGRFEFAGVPPGSQDLVVEVEGMAPKKMVLAIDAKAPAHPDLVVQLEAAHKVLGKALDAEGKPIDGTYVTARLHEPNGRGRYVGSRSKLAADGSFAVGDLPGGFVDLEFFGSHNIRHVEKRVAVDREDLRITLRRAAKLAGTVVAAATGAPIKSFRIKFLRTGAIGYSASWHKGQQFDHPKGEWLTEHEQFPVAAKFLVEASATGYGRVLQSMSAVLAPSPAQVVFRLPKGEVVRGRVRSQRTGDPVAKARVVMFTKDDPLKPQDRRDLATRLTATTAADGTFAMRDVPPGEMSLHVSHADYPDLVDGPFVVTAGVDAPREIQLPPSAEIVGMLLDDRDAPVGGAEIHLSGLGLSLLTTKSDAAGRFVFRGGVAPGRYTVSRATLAGGKVWSPGFLSVDVAAGERKEVRLTPKGKCVADVRLTLPAGKAGNWYRIEFRREGGKDSISVQPKGLAVQVRGLAKGRYTIQASSWAAGSGGRLHGRTEVEIVPGRNADIELQMKAQN